MDVQVSPHDSTVHVQGFSTKRGKQTIVMSLGDVTVVMLTQMVGGYIRRMPMTLKALIWVLAAVHLSYLFRSH